MTGVSILVWAACLCEVGGVPSFTLPDGKYISEFSGKMNVPDLPPKMPNGRAKDCHNKNGEPGACGFSLWPGIEPSGLLFQQFLTNAYDGQWQLGMQYWGCGTGSPGHEHADTGSTETCRCRDGWCDRSEVDDPVVYPSLNVGDTISWYTRLLSNSTSDNLWYQMGWSSSGGKEQHLIGKADHGGRYVGVVYEGPYLREDGARLPQTNFILSDLKLLDQNGQDVGLDWSGCTDDAGGKFTCSSSEVKLEFPGATGMSTSCEAKCATASHCCTGDTSSFQHPSCAMGCKVSQYTRSVGECKAMCNKNDNTCNWNLNGIPQNNCAHCPSGCSAAGGVQECLDGCDFGFPLSCEDSCARAGHGCTGAISSSNHPSCAMGCKISQHTGSVSACKATCHKNDNTCKWNLAGIPQTNCGHHSQSCSPQGVQECLDGCEFGFGSLMSLRGHFNGTNVVI